GDQLVEVDVLDVEGLAHVGAAGAQQLGDLRLVPLAVEPGLHRVRRGGDLAQRQPGGKDFDEERFHPTSGGLEAVGRSLWARTSPLLVPRYRDVACALSQPTKMAFWGVWFPPRANFVRRCGRGASAQFTALSILQNRLSGGNIPLK